MYRGYLLVAIAVELWVTWVDHWVVNSGNHTDNCHLVVGSGNVVIVDTS